VGGVVVGDEEEGREENADGCEGEEANLHFGYSRKIGCLNDET